MLDSQPTQPVGLTWLRMADLLGCAWPGEPRQLTASSKAGQGLEDLPGQEWHH
jgi:hypothetical protein